MRRDPTGTPPLAESATPTARPAFVWLALGIVYVVWGSTYLGIRVMVRELPPLASSAWRYLAAGLLLGGLLAVMSGSRRLWITGRQLGGCALLGLLLPAFGNGMVSIGESRGAPSGITALIIAAVPLWIIVYRTVSGDRPTARTVVGVLLGFAGLVGLVAASGLGGDFAVVPCLVVAAASVSWSLGSWLTPWLPLPADPFVTAVYEMLTGAIALGVMALIGREDIMPSGGSDSSWLAWGYLVVFGSVVAFSAYVWVLDNARISLVTTYAYVNPVVAVALGSLVLDEPITLPILVGGAVAVGGVALVVAAERT